MGYTKLDDKITRSSLWAEPLHTRVVFVTMLALKDKDGFVNGTLSWLIRECNIDRNLVEEALETLSAPDAESRTEEHDGRRIAKVESGWIVLNHEKYRMSETERASERKRVSRHSSSQDVTGCHAASQLVTACHSASQDVTACHSASQGISPPPVPPPYTDTDADTNADPDTSNLKKNNIYNMRVENSKGQDNENKNDSRTGQDIEDNSRIEQVDVIAKKILNHWPDYPEENARVIAARFIAQYGDLDILDVLEKAWTAWEPNRTIYDRSGLAGYLAAWMNNTRARQPVNGYRNTENSQKSTVLTRLQNLERRISNDEMIELPRVAELIAEVKEDKIKIPNYIRNFLYELKKANVIDFEHGKIQSFTIRDPCKPSELRKGGPQYLGADEISKMLADKFSLATIGKNTGGTICK